MKDLSLQALDQALQKGASYADVRAIESSERLISTKNGKVGQAACSEASRLRRPGDRQRRLGLLLHRQMTPAGVEAAPPARVEIARASAMSKKHEATLAPEGKHEATWTSPVK